MECFCLQDDEKNAVALSPACPDSQNPFLLLSTASTVLPPLSQTRTQQLTASLQAQVSQLLLGSRGLRESVCLFLLIWNKIKF